uniref:Uncharacterized protein n=1 Tax=Adineta vaga TaxID=104782 RepID=B3G4C7_ADIVA|nr:unknown [Adineta vaga]
MITIFSRLKRMLIPLIMTMNWNILQIFFDNKSIQHVFFFKNISQRSKKQIKHHKNLFLKGAFQNLCRAAMPLFSFYIIFFVALLQPHHKNITVLDITQSVFEQLFIKHSQTLSCPCVKTTIPLETFITTTITLQPICTSIFVTNEWIRAFYVNNVTKYNDLSFIKIAYAQVTMVRMWVTGTPVQISFLSIKIQIIINYSLSLSSYSIHMMNFLVIDNIINGPISCFIRFTDVHIILLHITSRYTEFKLLANLCTFCNDTNNQNRITLHNQELVSIELFSEKQLKNDIRSFVEHFKNSTAMRIISYVDYLRTITHANLFISMLQTNTLIDAKRNEKSLQEKYLFNALWSSIYMGSSGSLNDDSHLCSVNNKYSLFELYITETNWVDVSIHYVYYTIYVKRSIY